jgi:hypothetical protein
MKLTKRQVDKEEPNKQLDLGIKEPFKNRFLNIRRKTSGVLLQLEVKKFLKDVFFWFVTVTNTMMLVLQGYVLFIHFNNIPTIIPILNYYRDSIDRLVNKEYLFIFPAITTFSILLEIFVIARYYNKEKVLAKFILFCSLLTSISSSIVLLYLVQNF